MGPQLILTSKDCHHDSRLRENQYLNKGIDGSTFYGGKNANVKRQCNQYQLLFEKKTENELFPSPKRCRVNDEPSFSKAMETRGKNLQKGNTAKGSLLSLLQVEDNAQAHRSVTEGSRYPLKVKSDDKYLRREHAQDGCKDFIKTIPRSQTDRRYFGRVLPKTYRSVRQCLDFGSNQNDSPAKVGVSSVYFTDDDDDKENLDSEVRASASGNQINIEGIIESLRDVDYSPVKQYTNSKSVQSHCLFEDVDVNRQTTDTFAVKQDACQQTEEFLQIGFPNPAGSNKCWMNATLQALFGLEPLISDMAFASQQLDAHIKPSGTTKVLRAFLLLVKSYQRKKMAIVRSSLLTLSRSLGSLDKMFLSKCQQDAAEFLVRLVDCFRDEFEKAIATQKQVTMEKISLEDLVAGGDGDEEASQKAINPITENVGFTLKEMLSCTRCRESADKTQEHLVLFVDIPRMPEGESPRLEDAVDCYMKADTRELTCGKCSNSERSVVTTVQKLPRCLIIQVKRYTVQNSKAEKLADALAIPLVFSMKKYVTSDTVLPSLPSHNFPVNNCSNEEDSLIQCDAPADVDSDCDDEDKDLQEAVRQSLLTHEEQGHGPDEHVDDNSNERSQVIALPAEQSFTTEESSCCLKSECLDSSPEFTYRLVAAVSHHGHSPNSGHYVADVYSHQQRKWYHFDDDLVYETSCKDVTGPNLQCNGYIFFYMYRPLFKQSYESDCGTALKTEDQSM